MREKKTLTAALLSSRGYSLGHSFIWEKSSTVWELMSAAVKDQVITYSRKKQATGQVLPAVTNDFLFQFPV